MITFSKQKLRCFSKDDSGVITIESLLCLPILFFWYVAFIVYFDAFATLNTNEKASYTISDMISRQQPKVLMTQAHLEGYNKIFSYILKDQAATKLRVTSIKYDKDAEEDEQYQVAWSNVVGGNDIGSNSFKGYITSDLNTDLMKPLLPVMEDEDYVTLVETFIAYEPPFNVGIAAQEMSNFIFTRPRFVSDTGIQWGN